MHGIRFIHVAINHRTVIVVALNYIYSITVNSFVCYFSKYTNVHEAALLDIKNRPNYPYKKSVVFHKMEEKGILLSQIFLLSKKSLNRRGG